MCKPLARWARAAGQNEFWVCIGAWEEAGWEWSGGRPLVGWFWGGCYLFQAACDPICAGMLSRVGIASMSSLFKSAGVFRSANHCHYWIH